LNEVDPEIRERAARIRLILLDVDGVLTDGRIHIDSNGGESRSFFVRDGLGIRIGQDCGLVFGIISGRESSVVTSRAAELGIGEVHQRVLDKAGRLSEICERLAVAPEAVCFVGDDLIDLPAMRLAGLAVAPSDADASAREAAHFVTRSEGGRGAVRELIDLVLNASGKADQVMRRFSGA
jgi:3-deoxy-D-manno-octulosonate 8-phosphate phosphatase (KDO 8-P phosphatase)